jgi:hypothetical protein
MRSLGTRGTGDQSSTLAAVWVVGRRSRRIHGQLRAKFGFRPPQTHSQKAPPGSGDFGAGLGRERRAFAYLKIA